MILYVVLLVIHVYCFFNYLILTCIDSSTIGFAYLFFLTYVDTRSNDASIILVVHLLDIHSFYIHGSLGCSYLLSIDAAWFSTLHLLYILYICYGFFIYYGFFTYSIHLLIVELLVIYCGFCQSIHCANQMLYQKKKL